MNQSTKLLFRLVRLRLALGMSAAFLLFLFITLVDPPLDTEYIPLLPIIGFGLALLMGLHYLLGHTMFPVTDRQVAWIPMAAGGLVSLSGATGLLFGQALAFALGRIRFDDTVLYWFKGSKALPITIFASLIVWRFLRLNPGFAGFLGFLPILILGPGQKHVPEWFQPLIAWWPLWMLGCAFLVWEGPLQTAMLRRLDFQEAGTDWFKRRIPVLNGPVRLSWPTRLADAALYLLLLLALVLFIRRILSIPADKLMRNPAALLYLCFLAFPLGYIAQCWRQNRASGMSIPRSFVVLLIEMTCAAYAYKDLMGVNRGIPVHCRFCGGWRTAWQPKCPHCGDQEFLTESAKTEKKPGFLIYLWPVHDPGAMLFRGMIPIYILSIILIRYGGRWFE